MTRAGFRLLSFLLLSASWLGGCTLLHPHRITNPNLPPGYKQQQRAARKAQQAGLRTAENEAKSRQKTKDKDAGSTADAPGATPSAATASDEQQVSSGAADKSTVKYDKHGLMKKPKLKHRRYYKPASQPGLGQRLRNLFQKKPQRHHGKSKRGESKPAPKAPASPTPAPVDTGLTP